MSIRHCSTCKNIKMLILILLLSLSKMSFGRKSFPRIYTNIRQNLMNKILEEYSGTELDEYDMANILMKYDRIMSERKSGVINFTKNLRGRNEMNIGEISGNGNVINNNYVNVYQQNTDFFKDQIKYILEHMKTKIVKPIEDILNDVVSIITPSIRTTASTTSLLITTTTKSTTTSSALTTSTTSTSTTTSTKTTSSTTSTRLTTSTSTTTSTKTSTTTSSTTTTVSTATQQDDIL